MKIIEVVRRNLRIFLNGKKQLAVAHAAREAGKNITQQYISALLKGKESNPTIETLEAIACGLGMDPFELLNDGPQNRIKRSKRLDPWIELFPNKFHRDLHQKLEKLLEKKGFWTSSIIGSILSTYEKRNDIAPREAATNNKRKTSIAINIKREPKALRPSKDQRRSATG